MADPKLDRREFLSSGLAITGATLFGASALACNDAEPALTAPTISASLARAADGSDLAEPAVIASVGGRLSADIVCETRPVTVAGRRVFQPVTYNGSIPGPTLWVRPGDLIDIRFTNHIVFDQVGTHPGYGRPPRDGHTTNLHYHGMHISPIGTADNMNVMVPANGTFRYSFRVPMDHPAGLYWYHAHAAGLVTNQVGRGAAGMIYVANAYTDSIGAIGLRRRLMMLQQAYLRDADDNTLTADDGQREDPQVALSIINGQLMPEIHIQPGEPQVWSLVNASTSAFYLLQLEGHTFDVIAEDGIPLRAPRLAQTSLLFPSAKRFEVVVHGGEPRTEPYVLSYASYNQGVDTWPNKQIGKVIVSGDQWTGAAHPGADPSGASLEDLTLVDVPANRKRTITLGVNTEVAEGEFGRFTMNGHAYDPERIEWTSKLGTVEEWLIVNETEQEHPFHVHVNPFQLVARNGTAVDALARTYQDTCIVPRFGSITVRTRFTDFIGAPVLMHCHILDHEDMGMMTSFEIAE